MRFLFFFIILFFSTCTFAQNKNCQLKIGTNLSGLSDWMTEMPFVDMMNHARTWGTRNRTWLGNGAENKWNTELIGLIETDENGYPLELPFYDEALALEDSQMAFTVWASLEAWEPGIYIFLFDGEGEVNFRADGKIIKREEGRLEVEIIPSQDSFLELQILKSKKGNHLRNFNLLMPGHESNYLDNPFNPLYLEKLEPFEALRFMDWGRTNNWGESAAWHNYDEAEDTILVPWSERSPLEYYTWSHNKGVPYEMMCDLCNTLGKDMWVCVPHNASNAYIRTMANLIKERLNPELTLYAEYSNEVWNWMFGQTHWLKKFYCDARGYEWPEGIVDRIQNNLDIWKEVFSEDADRLITVAGGQTAWQDVSNRIVHNLEEGSFDALNITGYFGFSEDGDRALDKLGSTATVTDVAHWVRENMDASLGHIQNQFKLARQLDIPVVFYEAGQHITAHPFGEDPSYAEALLAMHRDTAMYNIYHEWFNSIESVIDEGDQSLYMNFSFVGGRSSKYGSWGILETLDQDTAIVYAPKYHATLDQINYCGRPISNANQAIGYPKTGSVKILHLTNQSFTVQSQNPMEKIEILDTNGKILEVYYPDSQKAFDFNLKTAAQGIYLVKTSGKTFETIQKISTN